MKFNCIKFYLCINIILAFSPQSLSQGLITLQDVTIGGTGNEVLKKSILTKDGGVLSVGYANIANIDVSGPMQGNYDYWIVKTDANGRMEWNRLLGSMEDDFVYDVTEDLIYDGFVIIGYTESKQASGHISANSKGGTTDSWIVKLSSDGTNIVWEHRIGGDREDYAISVQQTQLGNFLIAGFTNSSPNTGDLGNNVARGDYDYWLINLNNAGTIQLDRRLGGSGFEGVGYEGGSMMSVQTTDGGYIIGGRSFSSQSGDKLQNAIDGSSDFWIVKLNVDLSIQWETTLGGTEEEKFTSLLQTADGGYILAGTSASEDPVLGMPRKKDYWIVKLDQSGLLIWDYKYGGSQDEELNTIIKTADGGYLLGGYSMSDNDGDKIQDSYGSSDYWLVKIMADGIKEWDAVYGGTQEDYMSSIVSIPDGKLFLTGTSASDIGGTKTSSNKGGDDFWMVIVDEVPLPIELISFQAKAISVNKVELLWITASETDNAFFYIERSDNMKDFNKILEVAGAGRSIQTKSYLLFDTSPIMGTSYYRLKQIDFDGKYTYSKIVSVQLDKPDMDDLFIWPNPTDGSILNINLGSSLKNQDLYIVIEDILGKRIYDEIHKASQQGTISLNIDKITIKKGTYIISLTSKNKILKKKLIVD